MSRIQAEHFYAHSSSNHNNERLVKIASRMQDTGRSEITTNIYPIATNIFTVNLIDDIATDDNEDDVDRNNGNKNSDNTPSNNNPQ